MTYRCYPVRISDEGEVFTLDGVRIGGPETARLIREGFERTTFTDARTTDEIIEGTGIKLKRKRA